MCLKLLCPSRIYVLTQGGCWLFMSDIIASLSHIRLAKVGVSHIEMFRSYARNYYIPLLYKVSVGQAFLVYRCFTHRPKITTSLSYIRGA